MKKLLSAALCAAMLVGTLASCASTEGRLDPAITLTSSDARANAEWLDNRLDEIPDDVIIGIGSDDEYGIDMSDFESDGYILREMGGEVLIFGASADGLDRAVRKYAKAAEAGATAELDEVYHEGYRIEKLTVAGRDISEYTIYYPSENNENMLFAVSELQRLVKKACGAELAAVEGAPSGAAPEPVADEGDELLPAAIDVVMETGQASVSMLQRRLKLGYARAARIMDEMEERGLVGPFEGSKPRQLLITREQWQAIKDGAPISSEPVEEEIP